MPGFASQPFGSTSFGIGQPSPAPTPGGAILRDTTTGASFGSRAIDPVTRDYVLDANGRAVGMNDVQQLVYIAVSTVKNSSAMPRLGHTLGSLTVIGDTIEREVRGAIEAALAHLTSRKLIAIVSITVQRMHPGAVAIRLAWRDLSTQQDHTLEI